jgi:cobaltochelatase CobN
MHRSSTILAVRTLAVVACTLLHWPGDARAETLMAVVSDRAAPLVLEAAEELLFATEHRVRLRTPEQLAGLSDAEVTALWSEVHAVLLANVFGEQAQRLARLLRTHAPRAQVPILAVSGEPELTALSRLGGVKVFDGMAEGAIRALTGALAQGDSGRQSYREHMARHPAQARWIEGSEYWRERLPANVRGLLRWLLREGGAAVSVPEPLPRAPIRYVQDGTERSPRGLKFARGQAVVALLDYEEAETQAARALHGALCEALSARGLACLSVFARWGAATASALESLKQTVIPGRLSSVVSLQDFVLGGSEDRGRATRALEKLDVPVIKAIRLVDRTEQAWRASHDGLPWDTVHYRLAMPELQGIGVPVVVEAADALRVDAKTGLAYRQPVPLRGEIAALAAKLARWSALQMRPARDKRVAIVYYNHPPGRHNIGADNLDVPASLWELLRALQAAGYSTGALPASPEALLSRLQRDGVNLPENREALADMATRVPVLGASDYARYFETLPERARVTMTQGPLGALRVHVERALAGGEVELAAERVAATLKDVRHVLEGSQHRARERALRLLDQLEASYARLTGGDAHARERVRALTDGLVATGIEGLSGWGAPPGRGMVHDGEFVLPGVTFGNVFLGPQPPRGWELDEELLHANLTFAPPHQYLAYYHWLREVFRADVVIHVGRHSTYEFLPGPSAGLSRDDFSQLVLADLPSLYLYIVDGVGEGIQAKRRGGAIVIDHLTPPLSTTPLYDELLSLRQMIESFEASQGATQGAARARAVAKIREGIAKLKLEDALRENMDAELKARGIGFHEVSDELLVHEVGHYLTELQERFMPFGLHVFGRPWKAQAVERMLASMDEGEERSARKRDLVRSPARERAALLAALEGRFVPPGHGNDPIRRPDVLPTGRNFHALDGGLLPTQVAYSLGAELARSAREKDPGSPEGSESVVLWASDTVRDEGVMVGFGLAMLGVRPVWNSRGILRALAREPLSPAAVRRDVSFVTSGLFRDLYENLIAWLDRAVLLALDGASETLRVEHSELTEALASALAPLGELRAPGNESLAQNQVAAHWARDVRALLASGVPAAEAGRQASVRLFGNAPGGYGAGVNRLAERSGAFSTREELSNAFTLRMGHAYGVGLKGMPMRAAFDQMLARTERSFLGRASHLYGLLDNNDAFDYLGGLRMAVEARRGKPPEAAVVQYADPKNTRVESAARALFSELRARHLNPAYLKALMQHGYAGARTLNTGFVENLWGWQVTSPDLIRPWVWDEVNSVYLRDALQIGLTKFLEEAHNIHVKANIEAILLVAAHKGFWTPDEATVSELAGDFARIVASHGLPGSGHTRPDHPVMAFIAEHLDAQERASFEAVLARSLQPRPSPPDSPRQVSEVKREESSREGHEAYAETGAGAAAMWKYVLVFTALALFALGVSRGRR